jgi:hypothetical protein
LNRTTTDQDIYLAKYNKDGDIIWVKGIGGLNVDTPVSLVTDNTNVYLLGSFIDASLNFYDGSGVVNTTLNKTESVYSDIFMVKYDKDGKVLWKRRIGGLTQTIPVSLVTDNKDLYVTGHFQDISLNFYNSNGDVVLSLNKTNTDINTFVAKYNCSNGNVSWANQIQGLNIEKPVQLAINNKNIYVSGHFNDISLNFYNSVGILVLSLNRATTDQDIYLAKYTTGGIIDWVKGIGGLNTDTPVSLVTDNTGVYLSGTFIDISLNFYDRYGNTEQSFYKTESLYTDAFIVKYNIDGTINWKRMIGGLTTSVPVSLVTDNKYLCIAGKFNDRTLNLYNSVGGVDGSFNKNTNDNTNETFVALYEIDGRFKWARRIAGDAYDEEVVSVVINNFNVYVTGTVRGNRLDVYSPSTLIKTLHKDSGTDTFLLRISENGTVPWIRRIGTTSENDKAVSLITENIPENNSVYLSGYFDGITLNFYSESRTPIKSFTKIGTSTNTYIAKYDGSGNLSGERYIGMKSNTPVVACLTTMLISNICFPKDTTIMTDQGIVKIQEITNQTINGLKVEHITEILGTDNELVCFEKDSLYLGCPSEKTIMTRNHKILYHKEFVDADTLLNDKICLIPYDGEVLYNVLLEKNSTMNVNNLLCETLDVNNIIALFHKASYTVEEKNIITKILNKHITNKEKYRELSKLLFV